MKTNKVAFTLVELIVVVTILSILGTISFISFNNYSSSARDSKTITNIKNIEKGAELRLIKIGKVPVPGQYIEVSSSGVLLTYQGVAGEQVLDNIGVNNFSDDFYTYSTNQQLTKYEVIGFLESPISSKFNISKKAFANLENTFTYVGGYELGILIDENNTPINKLSSVINAGGLDVVSDSNTYKVYFNNGIDKFEGSGRMIGEIMKNRIGAFDYVAYCPDGFIPIPGNEDLGQESFCVAKYEMTYTEEDSPGTENSTNHFNPWIFSYNSYKYDPSKKIESRAGDFPIADITQQQAIDACKSLGDGYHLITNKQWVTIARDIETQPENWLSGVQGNGSVYKGNGNDLSQGNGCSEIEGAGDFGAKTGGVDNKKISNERSTCDEIRQMKISNGALIWDFAGNIEEHVNKANNLNGQGAGSGSLILSPSTGWLNWDSIDISDEERLSYGPLFREWSYATGIGSFYNNAVITDGIFTRGGQYQFGAAAGIYYLVNSFNINTSYSHIGFRCSYLRD